MPEATHIRTTRGRGRLFDSVLDTVGDTPCVRINHLAPKGVRMYVKIEAFNPAASVKDRLALNIIEAAERNGTLKPGQTVVEATSGNTGIGLAMVCAQKSYPLVVTMADSFSIERRRLMRILGAKVVLTPRAAKGYGMYRRRSSSRRRTAGFSPASSKPTRTPISTNRRPDARSSATSRTSVSITSSPATAPAAR
jgi:cysteine synthase A